MADVAALKTLQSKVARVMDVMEGLLYSPPPLENWPEWLARLKALLSQYTLLQKELKPTLAKLLVVPNDLTSSSLPDAELIPNVLLRTKLAPEVEEYMESISLKPGQVSNDLNMRILSQIMSELLGKIEQSSIHESRPTTPAHPNKATTMSPEDATLLTASLRKLYCGK